MFSPTKVLYYIGAPFLALFIETPSPPPSSRCKIILIFERLQGIPSDVFGFTMNNPIRTRHKGKKTIVHLHGILFTQRKLCTISVVEGYFGNTIKP